MRSRRRSQFRFGLLVAFAVGVGMPCSSQEVTELPAVIRDFRRSHPSMENPVTWDAMSPELGIVRSSLGDDRKPVFNNGGLPFRSVTSEEDFSDWFNDVPGRNLSTDFTMILRREANSENYVFNKASTQDDTFFPIDGKLFGNEGQLHNSNFTLELHAQIIYRGGERFTLTADDDAWLFLDNQLAVDLGGLHFPVTRTVNFDRLGLTIGRAYSLDLFYAERKDGGVLSFSTSSELHAADALLGRDCSGDGVVDFSDLACQTDPLFLQQVQDDLRVLPGDFDGQGGVGFEDFLTLSTRFNLVAANYGQGDINLDGQTDFADFLILSANFGKTQTLATATVPEPSVWSMIGLGGLPTREPATPSIPPDSSWFASGTPI